MDIEKDLDAILNDQSLTELERTRRVSDYVREILGIADRPKVSYDGWLTIFRYSKNYNIPQQTIRDWIDKGIIPAKDVQDLEEVPGIQIIKDRLYHDQLDYGK